MSWNIQALGEASAVKAKLNADFDKVEAYLAEPEKSICRNVRTCVMSALDAQAPNTAVKVEASGSMTGSGATMTNRFGASVEILYGFVVNQTAPLTT